MSDDGARATRELVLRATGSMRKRQERRRRRSAEYGGGAEAGDSLSQQQDWDRPPPQRKTTPGARHRSEPANVVDSHGVAARIVNARSGPRRLHTALTLGAHSAPPDKRYFDERLGIGYKNGDDGDEYSDA